MKIESQYLILGAVIFWAGFASTPAQAYDILSCEKVDNAPQAMPGMLCTNDSNGTFTPQNIPLPGTAGGVYFINTVDVPYSYYIDANGFPQPVGGRQAPVKY
ncbi:MAG: hypothetical protein K2X66_12460 [Cyanobacteria bacterium]|nr:hypothetical protein [Cyanobacteriota bacterium]